MSEPISFPDEPTVHAYVDGRLDGATRARVDAWLAHHPERAREIRGWRRDAQQLRAEFGGLPGRTVPPALDPAVIRVRRQRRMGRRLALAAVLVLAVGIGGVGGWQVREWTVPVPAPMADAVQAYRLFASNRYAPLDVTQHHAGEVQAWLDRHFPDAPGLPNLVQAGFRVVGGRLLATSTGPAALVLYDDSRGDVISFYIRAPSARRGRLSRGQRIEGNLALAYGSGHGYNVALVGDSRDARLLHRASASAGI